jgi:hypothetical protein
MVGACQWVSLDLSRSGIISVSEGPVYSRHRSIEWAYRFLRTIAAIHFGPMF